MQLKNTLLIPALAAFAFAGGALFTEWMPRANAQTQTVALPPIFEEGARLIGPTGSIEIHEVAGGWIRVKSLSALAKQGEELWMHVPSLSGAWAIDTQPVEEKK